MLFTKGEQLLKYLTLTILFLVFQETEEPGCQKMNCSGECLSVDTEWLGLQ